MLVRCAEARYKGVSVGLPPDDSSPPVAVCAEAVLQHVTAARSEISTLQEASRIPFPRKGTDDMVPRDGESFEDLLRSGGTKSAGRVRHACSSRTQLSVSGRYNTRWLI